MASDLGYEVAFVLDATHTFDHTALDGTTVTADEMTRATAASLQAEFATVMTTATALGGVARGMPPS
jgi:nicotinamidase-related amidase